MRTCPNEDWAAHNAMILVYVAMAEREPGNLRWPAMALLRCKAIEQIRAEIAWAKDRGISPNTYMQWRNYAAQYVEPLGRFEAAAKAKREGRDWRAVLDHGDFVARLHEAMADVDFQPPLMAAIDIPVRSPRMMFVGSSYAGH